MNIILFGPPGIGKSTIIGTLKTLGQRAIDLEDLYPNKIRYQINNLVDGTFIGAADLNPKRKYTNAYKVLLTMNQEAYDRRRSLRDQKQPGKAKQVHHNVADWITPNTFDWIIDTSNFSPLQVSNKLLSHFGGVLHDH